ncbi:hypothetical protein BP00DRAFT_191021 [Aspergillus indologenus CBS 114.80]|uniref:Uncharacterized protein n=1 Tax=Aspergillus indologenus CBS 114.80 TaxID=1450541 RepID=A0A2V5I961_9EURO|nr:hypothetical protein BP00DRAFT_191021 [Aspergillus indologenus CBS 114.80]
MPGSGALLFANRAHDSLVRIIPVASFSPPSDARLLAEGFVYFRELRSRRSSCPFFRFYFRKNDRVVLGRQSVRIWGHAWFSTTTSVGIVSMRAGSGDSALLAFSVAMDPLEV